MRVGLQSARGAEADHYRQERYDAAGDLRRDAADSIPGPKPNADSSSHSTNSDSNHIPTSYYMDCSKHSSSNPTTNSEDNPTTRRSYSSRAMPNRSTNYPLLG